MNNTVPTYSHTRFARKLLSGAAGIPLFFGVVIADVQAIVPCGDFDECKALVEINASDGDIGFHWLVDGEDQRSTRIDDPNGVKIWEDDTGAALREQKKTENFGESSEPLCWEDPDEDEEVVTLEEFIERWDAGTYGITGKGGNGVKLSGEAELTYDLPVAPDEVDFDIGNRLISWAPGEDLGECATNAQLDDLVTAGVLPVHPENVPVAAWEIVLEPDVEDGDPTGMLKFTVRLPGDTTQVTVPADYLSSLPDDTPVKIEVGAIEAGDNATFTEEDGFCVNETAAGCPEEEE